MKNMTAFDVDKFGSLCFTIQYQSGGNLINQELLNLKDNKNATVQDLLTAMGIKLNDKINCHIIENVQEDMPFYCNLNVVCEYGSVE